MKRIGVIPNSEKDKGFELTRRIVDWLVLHNCEPVVTQEIAREIGFTDNVWDLQDIYRHSEFLVVLGGDGTILRAAREASVFDTPLLGVNVGTLGYLTDVEASHTFEALEKAVTGKYVLEKRLMLESSLEGGGHVALNEVCVLRNSLSPMITMKVTINGEYIDHFRADGLIVSTPTGSTAYNLSCGGSILKPDSEMIAITPVSPHMIYARPFVIPAGDVITIHLERSVNADGIVTHDGQNHMPLRPGEKVVIKRCERRAGIMKTTDKSFFDVLRHKLVRSSLDNETLS